MTALDKAKAEIGVQVVERWILAVLRHRTSSRCELNQAIRQLLDRLNNRPFKKLPGCRQELFQRLDQPALRALPATPYTYAEWKKVRVHIDYHVDIEGHYYSVPYHLVKQQLDARITDNTLECFHKGERVASHLRSWLKGRHTTVREHMPESHQQYGDWSPERLIRWAEKFGHQRHAPLPPCFHPDAIPSRATAPAWVSCDWVNPMAMIAWKQPAAGTATGHTSLQEHRIHPEAWTGQKARA